MSSHRTLLLTDIVDSTRLNEELGDVVMAPLWRAHDRIARELIASSRGQEIARSDGFLVLFDSTRDAAGFALAYHRALRLLDPRLKARVGVHVGPVTLTENSAVDQSRGAPRYEIDGISLPLASRIMSTAIGGQTLVTAAAAQAIGSASFAIKPHGYWRLKGIREPVELFEVGDAGSPFEPPPDSAKAYRVVWKHEEWEPVRTIASNIPAERDAFVGREQALRDLDGLLDGPARLVTVLGIGGIGKTRLVLRYGRTWLGNYPDGVWFCDLSPARTLEGLLLAVSQGLGVPLGHTDAVAQIGTFLAARGPCLVILDNFEQVARHAESTLGSWLEAAPDAKFIVTSREVLGIVGEQTQVLAPMATKDGTELFFTRARLSSPATKPADVKDIASLVKVLDGLPLAIELAAARSRVMSPRLLLERMNERFTLLSARGGRHDRQMTLRSTLDWSWELLSEQEKRALAHLSVFEGGFTLAAVEAVLMPQLGNHDATALDLLQSLFDKSFVRQVSEDRFDLLQTVQEYAAQHLRAPGRFPGSGPEAAVTAETLHGAFFARLTEQAVTESRCAELENLAAACRRGISRADHSIATRTLTLTWSALELSGPFKLGLDLASAVLAMTGSRANPAAEIIRGAALRAMGNIQEAQVCFESALSSARKSNELECEAEALSCLGNLSINSGRTNDGARAHLMAALRLAQRTGNDTLECRVLNGLGILNYNVRRTDEARANYEAAIRTARRIKSRRWEGGVLGNLGNIQYAQGKIAEACASYEAGLKVARELGNKKWEANALCNLGLMCHLTMNPSAGRRHLQESLQLAREIGHAQVEAITLINLGITEDGSGNLEAAQAHLEAALEVTRALQDLGSEGQVLGYLALLYAKLGRTMDARRLFEHAKENLQTASNDVDMAIVHCQSAEAFLLVDDEAAARAEVEAAQAIASALDGSAPFELTSALDRARKLLANQPRIAA